MGILYLRYIESSIPWLIHGLLCVLAYLVWVSLALVLFPPLTIFRMYKLLERTYIKYRKLGTGVKIMDMPYLHESENNRNFINVLITAAGEPKIHRLRKWVERRILDNENLDVTYRRLKQKLSKKGFEYVWTDEASFSIKQHMPIYRGEVPQGKADVEKLFARIASTPFSKNISPWMIQIIPTKDKGSFYIYCRIHHVLGDGFAMMGLLSQLTDEKPQYIEPKSRQGMMTNPVKRVLSGIVTGPLVMLVLMFSALWQWTNPFRSKETPRRKTVSWSHPVSLESVKRIKNKCDTTVNDVVLSCFAGAIRRYLQHGDGTLNPDDQPISMTFNSRSAADKKKDKIPLGNHSGGFLLYLPVSVEDPVKRLSLVKDRMNRMKASSHPHLISFLYFTIIGSLPEYFGRLSTYSIKDHVSLIYSNVPGPLKHLFIDGHRIDDVIVIPPLHAGVGLVAAIFSYAGRINLTIMSDETVIADPDRLTAEFEREVQLLSERVLIGD